MSNYKLMKMSELTQLITDGKHGDCVDEDSSGYYFLSSKDLRDGKLYYDDPRQITYNGFLETHRRTNLKPGDILLANCGASIGRVGIAQNDSKIYKTTFQKSISVIKPIESLIHNRYLYYFLLCNSSYLIDLGGGTAQPNLLISDLKRVSILVRPLHLQKKIAAILTAYDNLIEINNRRINILEKLAEDIYREWFVRMRFPGYNKTKLTKGIPENWELITINKLVDFLSGYSFKSQTYTPSGKYGIVTIKNVQDGYFNPICSDYVDEIPHKMKDYCQLNVGDVLISLTGNVGRVCRVNAKNLLLNQRVAKLRTKKEYLLEYIYYSFRSQSFQELTINLSLGSTAQQNLSPIMLGKQKIVLPDENILKLFNENCSLISKNILHYFQLNELLKKTRDILLPRLISGRLSIENLDIKFPPSMEEVNA